MKKKHSYSELDSKPDGKKQISAHEERIAEERRRSKVVFDEAAKRFNHEQNVGVSKIKDASFDDQNCLNLVFSIIIEDIKARTNPNYKISDGLLNFIGQKLVELKIITLIKRKFPHSGHYLILDKTNIIYNFDYKAKVAHCFSLADIIYNNVINAIRKNIPQKLSNEFNPIRSYLFDQMFEFNSTMNILLNFPDVDLQLFSKYYLYHLIYKMDIRNHSVTSFNDSSSLITHITNFSNLVKLLNEAVDDRNHCKPLSENYNYLSILNILFEKLFMKANNKVLDNKLGERPKLTDKQNQFIDFVVDKIQFENNKILNIPETILEEVSQILQPSPAPQVLNTQSHQKKLEFSFDSSLSSSDEIQLG